MERKLNYINRTMYACRGNMETGGGSCEMVIESQEEKQVKRKCSSS
jgi:hypothetical protein